jgi:hypothetical protein
MPIYIGEADTTIILDCGAVVTAATLAQIHYRTPSGIEGVWTAAVVGTTEIYYITVANDLNEAGRWQIQAYVETPDWKGYGDTSSFEVEEPL